MSELQQAVLQEAIDAVRRGESMNVGRAYTLLASVGRHDAALRVCMVETPHEEAQKLMQSAVTIAQDYIEGRRLPRRGASTKEPS